MSTFFALFICVSGFCKFVDGPYVTQTQCERFRDWYNKPGSNYVYECWRKTVPVWEKTR